MRTPPSNSSIVTFAGEAMIGAVKADQPGDDPLQKRHVVAENGLQNGLLALESASRKV